MNNKEKNLLIWVMICASIVIAVLYSPMGSPENYDGGGFNTGIAGVDFRSQYKKSRSFSMNSNSQHSSENGLPRASMPQTENFDNYNIKDISVEATVGEINTSPVTRKYPYKVSTNSNIDVSAGANYAVQTNYNSISNENNSNNGGGQMLANQSSGVFSYSRLKSNSQGNDNVQSVNLDLTIFSQLNDRQGLGPGTNNITDPGEDPTGPPIPIPDGFWVLFLFAIGYALWISVLKHKLKKSEI